ncbi:TonB-dependent receptor [Phenylobacterium sp.]|uniref:TonB-dependent receptor n=1 Tax=Phenylobacterium sp. TaxID=1871053 RepID=UPI0012069ECA|nr:TonB-dependent receptor [Phenylobacterium sp.]THD60978.1 MAG: TonB-dependent receptor [Phenylobacterium sp.]
MRTSHSAAISRLLCGTAISLGLAVVAAPAFAAEAAAGDAAPTATAPRPMTGAGAEGTDVSEVIVTAEPNKAAQDAPSKASLVEMQPESIVSNAFIRLATPETGDWTTVASIAPSVSGITSNGGGIGEYNTLTLRGFQDGQFNLTFDGIAFGDTNDPTHHSASYFPASTLQAVVIDRGPGAAGDLGQANLGGAIHFFSLDPTSDRSFAERLTAGSFNTQASVTTINTGELPGGGKLLFNLDLRRSDGELSHSGGYANNEMVKFVQPLGSDWTLTAFGAMEQTYFNLSDAGPGATWQQVQLYGKDFALDALPGDEHNYKLNYEYKTSDFEYIDLKGSFTPKITAENQLYTYFYANKTTSVNDITGLIGGPNTSPPNITTAPQSANDIGGYDKLNEYRVQGDIVRLNDDFGFGTLKAGALVETSSTNRHNLFRDFTLGIADDKFHPPAFPFTTNAKLQENSKWLQYQLFADFEWRPLDNLTIQPGVKYVNFRRDVDAADESTAGGAKNQPLVGSNTYDKTLYFLTANYRITKDWSVYGQAATGFLVPSLSALYVTGVNLQSLRPQQSISYQTGTVYTHGQFTADADVYRVDVTDLVQACNIPDPTSGNSTATTAGFCNVGKGQYSGVEGEAAYAAPFGVTFFVNGSINTAKQLATAADPAAGIAASPAETLANAPKYTAAAGAIYHYQDWSGSLTYKRSGQYVATYTGGQAVELPGYDSIDVAVRYDFTPRYWAKLQVFNLADKRDITSFTGAVLHSTTDTGLYLFQAGRTIEGTIGAKF